MLSAIKYKIIAVGIAILAIASSGCSRRREISHILDRAEAVMDAAPDSALMLLRSINADDIPGEENRARYALLTTTAYDKNYLDSLNTNDSLIRIAVDYYIYEPDDNRNKMLAIFYHGRVLFNADSLGQSAVAFLKADELASKLGDYKYQGLANRNLAWIYDKTYNGPLNVDYARRSLEAYKKWGNRRYIKDGYELLGNCMVNNYQYDDAINLSDTLLYISKTDKDSLMLSIANGIKGSAYYHKKEFKKAIYYLDLWFNSNQRYDNPSFLTMLGISYLELNNLPKAEFFQSVLSSQDSIQQSLSTNIHIKKHEYDEAFKSFKRERHFTNSAYQKATTQNVSLTVSSYYDNKLNFFKQQIQNIKHNWIIAAIISIALISLVLLVIRIKHQRKTEILNSLLDNLKLDLARQALSYSKLLEQNESIRSEISSNKSQALMRGVYTNLYEPLADIMLHCQLKSRKLDDEFILKRINSIFSSLRYGEEKYNQLTNLADNIFGNAYTSFINDFPNLKSNYKEMFLYSLMGFSNATIQAILQIDQKSIYNLKYRLKKLLIESGPSAEKYIRLIS